MMCLSVSFTVASSVSLPLEVISFLPNQLRIAIQWYIWGTAWLTKKKSLQSFLAFLKVNPIHSTVPVKGLSMPFLLSLLSLLSALLLISSYTRNRAGEINVGKYKSHWISVPLPPIPPSPTLLLWVVCWERSSRSFCWGGFIQSTPISFGIDGSELITSAEQCEL